jgi:DNA-binding NarL/FixJ family response regulator
MSEAVAIRSSIERGSPDAYKLPLWARAERNLRLMRKDHESVWADRLLDDIALHPEGLRLSRRERQVLTCFSHGMTESMVGETLGMQTSTVHTHAANARMKLRGKNLAHTVANAIRQGLIT